MSRSHQEIVKAIKKNKAQLNAALMMLNTHHNYAIRSGAKINSTSLDNVYAKLILPVRVSLLELEFERIIYCWPEHTQPFIDSLKGRTLSEVTKWHRLIDYGFRKSYNIPTAQLNDMSLGATAFLRYTNLKTIIDEDLKTFIELRNRLAHGQWAMAMSNDGQSLNQDLTSQIWILTKKDLLLLKILVRDFPKICEASVKSEKGFGAVFDTNMHHIALAKRDKDLRYKFIQSRAYKSRPYLAS